MPASPCLGPGRDRSRTSLFASILLLNAALAAFLAAAPPAHGLTVGARRQVTTSGGYHPRWSPDGQRLAFTSGAWPSIGIAVIDAAGGEPAALPLDRSGDLYLSWHPGGDLIAFDGYDAQQRLDIYTVSVGSGAVARLTTLLHCMGPDWRPDGQRLAFGRDGDLWSVASDGGDLVQHTTGAAFDYYQRWSPDGTRLAYAAINGANHDIWIVDVGSGATTRFTTDPAVDNRPAWSPDGRWLAWTSERSGAAQVYARPVAGGEAILLSEGHAEAAMPDWKPDGSAVCYVSGGEVWVVEVGGLVPVARVSAGSVRAMYGP